MSEWNDAIEAARQALWNTPSTEGRIHIEDASSALRSLKRPPEPKEEEPRCEADCDKDPYELNGGRGPGMHRIAEMQRQCPVCHPKSTEAAPDPLTTCALCGQPAIGFGMADGKVLCHHETRHCYRRWTVYGDRPAAPEPVGCAACGWTADAHRDGFESACPGFVSPTGGVEGAK